MNNQSKRPCPKTLDQMSPFCIFHKSHVISYLKDKSGVGIIVDCSSDYTVVIGSIFFSCNLRNDIFQSVKKCEMTSFPMTSLLVDLNEAANCVDLCHSHC